MPKWRQTTAQQPTIGVMLKSVVTRIIAGTNVTISSTGPSGTGDVTINASGSGGGGVTAVTASAPLASSGGTTPNISLTGIVPIADGGTGTATPSLVAGTNVTITGSFPNQTINSTAGGGGGPVYDTVILAETGVLKYFKLNETSGTSAADAVGGTAGTYGSDILLSQLTLRGDNEPCPYFNLALTNSYVTLPATATGTGSFSVEFFFILSYNVLSGFIFNAGYGGNKGIEIYTANAGAGKTQLGIAYGGSTGNISTVSADYLAPGAIHHVVFTYDQPTTTAYGYLDAMPYLLNSTATLNLTSVSSFILGQQATGNTTNSFSGIIGKPSFYNVALTQSRVSAHMNAQRV